MLLEKRKGPAQRRRIGDVGQPTPRLPVGASSSSAGQLASSAASADVEMPWVPLTPPPAVPVPAAGQLAQGGGSLSSTAVPVAGQPARVTVECQIAPGYVRTVSARWGTPLGPPGLPRLLGCLVLVGRTLPLRASSPERVSGNRIFPTPRPPSLKGRDRSVPSVDLALFPSPRNRRRRSRSESVLGN